VGTNSTPQLAAIADQVIREVRLLSITATATDSNANDVLTFSLAAGAPTGATSIDPVSGQLTWTPSDGDGPGVYSLTVPVTDDGSPALSTSRQFTIAVNEVVPSTVVGRHASYATSRSRENSAPAKPDGGRKESSMCGKAAVAMG
jgi:hypothetical protein